MGVSAHHHHLPDRKGEIDPEILGNQGQGLCRLAPGKGGDVPPPHQDPPPAGPPVPGQEIQEGGLSRPVGPENPVEQAALQTEGKS